MGTRRSHDAAISTVEAAYAIAQPEEAWLAGIVEAALPDLARDFGVSAYTYDARSTPLRIGTLIGRGENAPTELVRTAVEMSSVNEDYVDATWRSQSLATVSETVDMQALDAASGFVAAGMNDILVVNGYDVSGFGVWLGAPLTSARNPTIAERRTWSRVASHLAAAFRLRRRSEERNPFPAAVLSTSGRLEHAEGTAKENDARRALHDAVLKMERARGRMRDRDPQQAVDDWRTLVDAQWTLLDHFERGGTRYIVAVENEPMPKGPDALTPRERQVLAAAGAGRTNKLIAYELGLSDSTVRVLLGRAAKKLRVSTRGELVALYRAHCRAA
jgi:DNA-binding CsgD family transcriptional regulator